MRRHLGRALTRHVQQHGLQLGLAQPVHEGIPATVRQLGPESFANVSHRSTLTDISPDPRLIYAVSSSP